MQIRVIPPPAGATSIVNGRTYTAAAGGYCDVAEFDVNGLTSNGWCLLGPVCTPTTRPAAFPVHGWSARQGMVCIDSEAGVILFFGGRWVSAIDGHPV